MKTLITLYKKTTTGATQTWSIQVEGNKHRSISGQLNGKLITNDWTVCSGKNIGQSNETSPAEQAMKEAEAKIKQKKEKGYSENVNTAARAKYFEPMLAQNWNDRKDEVSFPLFSQPKLDGIRCIITKDGMWSRNGKPIVAAPHIFEALQKHFKANPDLVFDGELYNHKFHNDFNKIVSLAKRPKPTADDLKASKENILYWLYDVYLPNTSFKDRSEFISKKIGQHQYVVVVPTATINNSAELDKIYGSYLEDGYEGQIVRTNDVYENKRSKYLLKRKEFIDEEYKILGIFEGEGNRAGTAGYMTFNSKNGTPFKSNIKGSFEYLTELLTNKKQLIGKLATIKYFNLTPDGIPRFPYVIAIRNYE